MISVGVQCHAPFKIFVWANFGTVLDSSRIKNVSDLNQKRFSPKMESF
jgi:hypothetical protein